MQRSVAWAIGFVVVMSGLACGVAQAVAFSYPPSEEAPTYKPTLAFDVASIRQSEPPRGFAMGIDNPPHASTFRVNGMPLEYLIRLAYGFGPFKLQGEPDWMQGMFVAVQAKAGPEVDAQLAKLTNEQATLEKRYMLQQLLADRLKLKAHWETKEGSVYNLVVAKGGAKLQPTKVEDADPNAPRAVANALGPEVHASGDRRGRVIECRRFSMRAVTAMLGSQIETPVIDKTGLTGTYDFTLDFTLEGSSEPDAYPNVFTALQEQLGLKLESGKGPVDVLVIEHVERPSEN